MSFFFLWYVDWWLLSFFLWHMYPLLINFTLWQTEISFVCFRLPTKGGNPDFGDVSNEKQTALVKMAVPTTKYTLAIFGEDSGLWRILLPTTTWADTWREATFEATINRQINSFQRNPNQGKWKLRSALWSDQSTGGLDLDLVSIWAMTVRVSPCLAQATGGPLKVNVTSSFFFGLEFSRGPKMLLVSIIFWAAHFVGPSFI